MHFLPDDDDEEEEDADDDEAVLNLMRMATMRRMTMVRSKREVNKFLAALLDKERPASKSSQLESNVFLSCSWEDFINSSIFRYITWPGQALGYKVVPMFLSIL